MMRRRYPRGFKEEMILKFESLSPKMRYMDFAKENDVSQGRPRLHTKENKKNIFYLF
jgi:hypothetical protein